MADELALSGHTVSHPKAMDLLRELGYSLQANRKMLEGTDHPDRNAQFEFINDQTKQRLLAGDPVISVDTKKKELVGAYKNNGRTWLPEGTPELVKVHDFINKELGRANPYGAYDAASNTGWVSVGTDQDTASFAVETIRRWWNTMGHTALSECIGPDDHGRWRWQQRQSGAALEVGTAAIGRRDRDSDSHLTSASGTSRWNKVEHRG